MRVHRLLLALGFVASLLTFSTAAPAPVEAQSESCWQAMPWAPLGDAVVGTGASAAFAIAPLSQPTLVAGAGGAAPAAGAAAAGGGAAASAGAAVGTAGLALGAFLAASAGTCKFLDWITNDGDVLGLDTPLITPGAATATNGGWQTWNDEVPGATPAQRPVIRYTIPALPALTSWQCVSNYVTSSIGSNNFPATAVTHLYQAITPTPAANGWRIYPGAGGGAGCYTAPTTVSALSAATTVIAAPTSVDAGGCGTLDWDKVASPLGPGVGGNCGLHPRQYWAIGSGSVTRALFYFNPVAAEKGWARVIHTDALCKSLTSTSATWIRSTSEPYYDREVRSRISVPTCAAGTIPAQIRAQRVPINLTSCTVGTVCYGTQNVIYQHTLPSTLTTHTTAPDWMTCLTAGATCGVPAMVSTVCVWGGFTMPTTEACNPTQLAGTSANAVTIPQATGTVVAPVYAPGNPSSTATPGTTPPTTPGSVTVEVPIEEGNGPRGSALPLPDEVECWPDGWGWFNPAEWVLRPVKCAITWAVVPSQVDLDERFARFDELRDAPPLSWGDEGVAYIGSSSLLFDEWSDAGPPCSMILDTEVCPRTWDAAPPGGVLSIVLALTMFGLWSMLVFAVWRFF